MPVYAYKGVTAAGKATRGHLDAESLRSATSRLRRDGVYLTEYPFADIAGSYTDIEELDLARMEQYRSGRLGYAMILFGLYAVIQGSQMIIPRPSKLEFDNVAWSPVR